MKEVIPNQITTFSAFTELINNSLQAKAKNIWIDLDYTKEEEVYPHFAKTISIKDDGIGVHSKELEFKTLDIATGNKKGGKGIGRFCAFQIGKRFLIETVGFDQVDKNFSFSRIPLSVDSITKFSRLGEIEFDTHEEILNGDNHKTSYKVVIDDLYDREHSEKNKRLTQQFLPSKLGEAIFERYPLHVFNSKVTFILNGKRLEKEDFIIGSPEKILKTYLNEKGESIKVFFNFLRVKSVEDIRVFLTVKNAGIDTVANSFKFDATWLSPKIGGWYIYVDSNVLTSDNYRNVDLDGLDSELSNFKSFIKDSLNEFFKEKNKEFDNFTDKLQNDDYYPYKIKEASSKSKEMLFNKLAYLVEDKYHILNNQEKLREIIYPLIDRTISNGELEDILKEVLHLDSKMITKFSALLKKTNLGDVIEFSEKVAAKQQELEFLEKIVYSEISSCIKERKQLHKYLEKMLWIFGEQYLEATRLLSDKGLENNLKELRDRFMKYKASEDEDNVSRVDNKKIRSITDLFLYSERVLDESKREVLIVELKAPKVKISNKELDQVKRYAQEIEESSGIPSSIKFKIILVSSDINRRALSEIKGFQANSKSEDPYLYWKNEAGYVEIHVLKWSDILEKTKRKLNYLSSILKTKDVDVQQKSKDDFADIEVIKVRSSLKKIAS
ncbi:ATP-binding protein [Algoriphagus sp. AGSA1]|uniref:ATP-binding protein n=1 Tax=Algoriphagus sp. AGSA1 TaxID=2907213 RepID=UPI001F372214|nr:ATP-binding protein [Algoriphagus sp. AGSA1]MCE7053041.1 ATP-binding protein [Algoriphagus sp. AGSA1]